jgi:putative Mg2+ transporter-C (MgtC) family protein
MVNPEVWQISHFELTIRIVFALIIGGLIGLEREWGDHAAGFRTHILVCLGSALIMLLSIYGFSEFATETNVRMDPARLAAQVISGIGFLGAGTILRTGMSISGLTTAASLWVVAALGLAVGAGFYYGALLTGFLVLVNLFLLNKFEKYFTRKRKQIELNLIMKESTGGIQAAMGKIEHYGATVLNLTADTYNGEDSETMLQLRLKIKMTKVKKIPYMLEDLRLINGIFRVNLQFVDSKLRAIAKDSKN